MKRVKTNNEAPWYQSFDAEERYLSTGSASTQDRNVRHKGKKKNPIGFSYQPAPPPALDSERDPKGFRPVPSPPGPEHKQPKPR